MGLGFLIICAVFVIAVVSILKSFYVVQNKEAAILEKLGKFSGVRHAGLHFKTPFVEQVRDTINLQVRQLDVQVETKTKDNVFVEIPVAVQYQVIPGSEEQAFYALTDHKQQIESYVQDTVRTSVAKMTLDESFASKDNLAQDVEQSLKESMEKYGWMFINTLVTDIRPDSKVRESMNSINAAQREKAAAVELAEAEKVKVIKEAEGLAEARRLQGKGLADQRMEISKGIAEQYKHLDDVNIDNPEIVMMMTQYFDTMIDVAERSNGAVMFMPSDTAGANNMINAMRNSLISADVISNQDGLQSKDHQTDKETFSEDQKDLVSSNVNQEDNNVETSFSEEIQEKKKGTYQEFLEEYDKLDKPQNLKEGFKIIKEEFKKNI